jgi:hypothetical protein
MIKRLFFSFFLLFSVAGNITAQQLQSERLKVFIDCHSGCDMTYIRTEITLIDFVFDRIAADVHVLITDENTGSGGDKYQLIFFGQNRFKNMTDTIYFDNNANNTNFEERDLVVKYLKLGLTPYITKTKLAGSIQILMKDKNVSEKNEIANDVALQKDRWNYWVFRTGLNGSLNKEEVYKSSSAYVNLSANRVTEDIKIGFELEGGKNKSIFKYEDDNGIMQKFTNRNDNYDFTHYIALSLNNHWSLGYELSASRSTFSNNKQRYKARTGIEYNIFPYKQVNTKYFTIGYILDLRHNKYFDSTLFDKTKETLAGQSIKSVMEFNQKWGTFEFGIDYHTYLHNWKYFNLEATVAFDIRITGGLSFNIYTSAELIRDQLFLPKEGATPQEVLTRRRQLASGYSFSTHFGISYRFGSILNNFINPRFKD